MIIVDEASMVNYKIWKDLCSYGKRIIAVGDHGQLPPINGSFNLMENPDIKLEKIHRQAKGNPIINLSIVARENGQIPIKKFSKTVQKINQKEPSNVHLVNNRLSRYDKDTMILCGYNFTRVELNNFVRKQIGHDEPTPVPGDRVICLRNNYDQQIFNGMVGTIESISSEDTLFYFAEIDMDGEDENYRGLIHKDQFGRKTTLEADEDLSKTLLMEGDLFDFGYAFTVHKAQGSQAPKVILFEQRFSRMNDNEWRKWLYTGVTRAQDELLIIGD